MKKLLILLLALAPISALATPIKFDLNGAEGAAVDGLNTGTATKRRSYRYADRSTHHVQRTTYEGGVAQPDDGFVWHQRGRHLLWIHGGVGADR